MLLSTETLKKKIVDNKLFRRNYGDKRIEILESSDFKVKPSSVDLTIGTIYEPSDDNVRSDEDLKKCATDSVSLAPGDTVLIEVKERFDLANDLGGIVFPPNGLSKEGVIMTNPGHIDPGYKGLITVCLVNMGKKSVHLKEGHIIARLLIFQLDAFSEGYKGDEVKSISPRHLDKLSKDFAGINKRLPRIVNKVFVRNLMLSLGMISLLFTVLAVGVPEFSKSRIEMLTHSSITKDLIVPVKNDFRSKIEALSDTLTKDYSSKIEIVSEELAEEISLMRKELKELTDQNASLKRELELRAKKEVSATND